MSRPKPPGVPGHKTARNARMVRVGERADATRARLPEARIVPPIAKQLQDIQAVAARELLKLAASQTSSALPTPGLPKALDQLASAVARAYQTERDVLADLADELADKSEEELDQLEAEAEREP